jgi:hypothetical protein
MKLILLAIILTLAAATASAAPENTIQTTIPSGQIQPAAQVQTTIAGNQLQGGE